ncbi:J domain-containing protein-like [Dioscorea cayenensis subsp. rotundata]|uniref:J domain-containing protein-like n=1 Tax=Dioscorea cayennensis subsp. rotundata TaxID=55577 RepID=A0AB40AMX8_DIOCR|nr:J domain-containing protein-like [Dioscorea cayenensis subsp. rotundata]
MAMECNKEEGMRARDIAENKMRNKDFVGAQRLALKAQQLFPNIDNFVQMLTVCEVHCFPEVKFNGDPDWYGILQVEPTADEALIKKQYRKLALLLHPDKNKFPGADAAFKLIGEANRTLSDQGKRSIHDLKRNPRNIIPAAETLSKSRENEVGQESVDDRSDGKTNHAETGNEVKFEKLENRRKQAENPSGGNSNSKRSITIVVVSSDSEVLDRKGEQMAVIYEDPPGRSERFPVLKQRVIVMLMTHPL